MQVFWQANVLVGRYCNTQPGKILKYTIYEVFSNNGMGWLSPRRLLLQSWERGDILISKPSGLTLTVEVTVDQMKWW